MLLHRTGRPFTRRAFLQLAAGVAGSLLLAKSGRARPPISAVSAAIHAAVASLHSCRRGDGCWRLAETGPLRHEITSAAFLLWGVSGVPALRRDPVLWPDCLEFLEQAVDQFAGASVPPSGLVYPLFTAALAAQVFAAHGDERRANICADLVETLRIRPELGWPADHPACGAWGDSPMPPRYDPAWGSLPDMLAPNLSATVLALQALHAAGRRTQAAAALPFISSCQNLLSPAVRADETPPDGGFFFTPGQSTRNKAGLATRRPLRLRAEEKDLHPRSYGSATCDGVLALHLCGVPPSDQRLAQSLQWLHCHAAGLQHPGAWPSDRTDDRESLKFYHAQAYAAVLASLPAEDPWAVPQRATLTQDLITSQQSNGSWENAYPGSMEDITPVATLLALRALTNLHPTS